MALPALGFDQHDPGRLHEQDAQVAIAALGYLAQDGAVPGGDLPGNESQPGGEVAALGEHIPGADRGHHRTGDAFTKGRDFAAWLGLVPKQMSTGDRTILGRISKRGNRYLRVLFVQAAWVVLIKPKIWERYGLKPWIEAAKKRLHHNVLAIALANKLARIAWSVLARGRAFEACKLDEVAIQPA